MLPPTQLDIETQMERIKSNYNRQPSDLAKYKFLMDLGDRNEILFYKVLQSDIKKFMPIIYTPTVGLACQKFGELMTRPKGLYITIKDKGKCVYASGSPQPSYTMEGKTFVPGQGNNVYIFPGVALACILTGATTVNDRAFLIAAQSVAKELSEEEVKDGQVYPSLDRIKEISKIVAVDVVKYLFDAELATYRPEPHDHAAWVEKHFWEPEYESILRPVYAERFDGCDVNTDL